MSIMKPKWNCSLYHDINGAKIRIKTWYNSVIILFLIHVLLYGGLEHKQNAVIQNLPSSFTNVEDDDHIGSDVFSLTLTSEW
jgi:hypothetical protein